METLLDQPSYPRTQLAVLDATERLNAQRPFSELSVNDIIDEAGISRTSFYAHFDSRTAVIAECLRRVMGEIAVAVDPFLAESETDPDAAIRASIRRWIAAASSTARCCARSRSSGRTTSGCVTCGSRSWPGSSPAPRA